MYLTHKKLSNLLLCIFLCTYNHLVVPQVGCQLALQPEFHDITFTPPNTSESNSDDDLVTTALNDSRNDPTITFAPITNASTSQSTTILIPSSVSSTLTTDARVVTTEAAPKPITPLQPQNHNQSSLTKPNNTSLLSPISPLNSTTLTSSIVRLHNEKTHVHPLLIYSIRYEIRSFNLSTVLSKQPNHNVISPPTISDQQHLAQKHTQSKTLIAGLKNTIGLDFYYSSTESYIFWIDVMEERIFKGTMMNGVVTNVNMVVQGGLVSAEGLAVDWIGKNIYWVESTLDHIEVASMNGSCRRTLIAGDMESPRAISLDPRHGLMFWTDWDKKSPRIERATMSGEDRKKIVDIKEVKGGWPNGLTLDYDALKIYWIDANSDSIHVVDYDGNNHVPLLRKIKSLGHPFAITLFENNLYWTDWKTNLISSANKIDGSEAKEIVRQQSRLFDIKVYHPNRQPRVDDNKNPCAKNNGNCSHLCLLSSNSTRKCSCPHLMRLLPDNVTCETYERVLLIGRTHEIRAVEISKPLYHIMAPISVPKVFNPLQFEYDAKSRSIFWADSSTNDVKRAKLAGTSIETIIDVIIEAPSGLALDWISGNIYVTSAAPMKSGKIYLSNLNGEYISILMDNSHGIIAPKSVVVHPLLGLLFCIDETENSEPIIFVAGMDGDNKRIIVSRQSEPKLNNPSSLAMDLEKNRVYWVNQANASSELASIQYYDIDSNIVVTLYNEAELPPEQRLNPGVICLDGDHLIMSSRSPNEAIIRASKDNINDRILYKTQSLDQILALRVYNASSQVGNNACRINNGGCSQLCVPTDSTHRTCKCTMGYTVNPSNETACQGKDSFLIFSYNLGMKGISLETNSSPEEYYLPPIHRAFRAFSIDFVHKDNLIYWVDNEEGSITRINRDTTNYQVVVQGLESEECIGIDWVAGNIYWLDPYYDIIEVARLNGTSRYVILSGDMDKANAIVVNPIKGYLVWSDIGAVPKIERARLDGSDRKIVVSSKLTHVDDLAIDYSGDYIYWVDSTLSLIERVKADGTARQTFYNGQSNTQSLQHHLVSIAINQNYLYVADSVQNQGSIIRFNKNNASEMTIIQQNLGDGIRDIAIFADQPIPPPSENPCARDNGGCQDLCLFVGESGRARCVCAHGKLNADEYTCRPYDTFIMYSKLSQIDSLHIQEDESHNNSPYKPISLENNRNIVSLAIDYEAQRIIYSEVTHDQICSVLFNGTDKKVLVEKQGLVEGVTFENNQLYWTSMQDSSVSRLNVTSAGQVQRTCNETGCRTATVEKLVKLTSEDKPRGIAVDSCTGYVYWTNWNNEASIQRATNQNGYKVESIINTNIKVPNGIAIDHRRRKLYWCDARLDKIETCDMDGSNRVVLISALPQHPFALAVWKNYVFWTDWLARGVFKADKYTGQQATQIKKVTQRPMGIVVASPSEHKCTANHCGAENGGCPPGFACVSRETEDGEPRVSCHEPERLQPSSPHKLALPGFVKNTAMCSSSKCHGKTYHEVILDDMERYRDIEPSLTDVRANTSSGQYVLYPNRDNDTRFTPTPFETRQSKLKPTPSSTSAWSTKSPTTAKISTKPIGSLPKSEVISTTAQSITMTSDLNTYTEASSTSTVKKVDTNVTQSTMSSVAPTSAVPPCQRTTIESDHDCDPATEFKCYLSERLICLPNEKRCNGDHDCPSKEDESDCYLASRGQYKLKQQENHWQKYVTIIMIILAAALAALFLVFGKRNKRRWFVGGHNGFGHQKMFEDNGTNIEISNPMFDEDDPAHHVHCAFSIDLNERTTNFSNPLYERQVLLVNDKHPPS